MYNTHALNHQHSQIYEQRGCRVSAPAPEPHCQIYHPVYNPHESGISFLSLAVTVAVCTALYIAKRPMDTNPWLQ